MGWVKGTTGEIKVKRFLFQIEIRIFCYLKGLLHFKNSTSTNNRSKARLYIAR